MNKVFVLMIYIWENNNVYYQAASFKIVHNSLSFFLLLLILTYVYSR